MQQFPRSARLWIEPLESRLTPAVTVRFDYSFDTSGLFADPEARAAVERVGAAVTARMTDNLTAITPSGGNTWTAQVYDAATGGTQTIANPTVGANEVVVYITGGQLGGALGIASGGAYSARGNQAWLDAIRTRGQGGVDAGTDYSPWGGLIAFNTATNWDWSAGAPAHTQYDFDSVALHEMMHVFGFGLENPSFTRNVSGGYYRGAYGTSVYGGLIPMQAGDDHPDHFAAGVRFAGRDAVMNPAITPGTQKTMTELDYAILQDVGWGNSAAVTPVVPPASPAPPMVSTPSALARTPSGPNRFLASGAGSVTVYDGTGQPVSQSGGDSTRVATGDVNGDGVPDYVTGSGPGTQALVTVVSGATGGVLFTFTPFDGFAGGVYVAAGDVNADGRADIAVGASEGGGPRVKVYDGRTGTQLTDFWGIEDSAFRGGVRVALGDINGDGRADLVCGAGEGGGPRVAAYDGRTLTGTPTRLFWDFMAFEPGVRNGVYVAVADLNGDGYGDIVCGAGSGGPRVTGFNGRSLMNGISTDWVANFFAGDPTSGRGVRVAATDVNGDGQPDLVTGPAAGTDGVVRVYAGTAFRTSLQASPFLTVTRPDWATNGAFVG